MVEEAENPRHPLLERLRFVSISASNLDEFYSVRVAGLIGQAKAGITVRSADGRTPAQQLAAIKVRRGDAARDQQRVWIELQAALLGEAGIEVCEPAALSADDIEWLDSWFMERVFPVLTPLAIDPGASVPVHSQHGPRDGAPAAAGRGRAGDARRCCRCRARVERFIRLPAGSEADTSVSSCWRTRSACSSRACSPASA